MKDYLIKIEPKFNRVTYNVLSYTGVHPVMHLRRNRWSLWHDLYVSLDDNSTCDLECTVEPENGCTPQVCTIKIPENAE